MILENQGEEIESLKREVKFLRSKVKILEAKLAEQIEETKAVNLKQARVKNFGLSFDQETDDEYIQSYVTMMNRFGPGS